MRSDAGQAFPLYITAIAGLLFLAVAYFAVGQAAANRNDAQGAADAAALAAAHDAREQLSDGLLDTVLDPGSWDDILGGEGFEYGSACAAAQDFAAKNDADTTSCDRVYDPDDGFTVTVRNRKAVDDTLVPGTESKRSEATATAVLESRCELREPDDTGDGGEDDGRGEDDGGGSGGDDADDDENRDKPPLELDCDGRDWSIDPDDLDVLPDPGDLFSVRLVD
ncbi:pilus assembly protein TadG-related protein [Streptomyces sp. MAR4 CNX-425]|uniref:pilus assembly protein TadG-related protein n=1 Tax=Streptomyces sp. MAR4 CNX-425 TaxID=3406343 RepID=UPI003B50BC68